MTRLSKLLCACLAMTAIALLVSCGGSDEPAETTETPQAARPAPQAVTPAPKFAAAKPPLRTIEEQLEAEVELPAGYPSDAPIYPGSKTNTAEAKRGAMTAVFSTADSPEQVTSFVKDHFAKQGWVDVQETPMPGGGAALQAHKGRRMMKVVVATLDNAGVENKTLMMVSADPE